MKIPLARTHLHITHSFLKRQQQQQEACNNNISKIYYAVLLPPPYFDGIVGTVSWVKAQQIAKQREDIKSILFIYSLLTPHSSHRQWSKEKFFAVLFFWNINDDYRHSRTFFFFLFHAWFSPLIFLARVSHIFNVCAVVIGKKQKIWINDSLIHDLRGFELICTIFRSWWWWWRKQQKKFILSHLKGRKFSWNMKSEVNICGGGNKIGFNHLIFDCNYHILIYFVRTLTC